MANPIVNAFLAKLFEALKTQGLAFLKDFINQILNPTPANEPVFSSNAEAQELFGMYAQMSDEEKAELLNGLGS